MAETLIKQNANVDDTVRLISDRIAIDSQSQFIQQLNSKLNTAPGCVSCFLSQLHDYVYRNVRYVLDPIGRERVLRPETTIRNREGDCKKMSVIIASSLKAAGIPALLKHVFFLRKDGSGHYEDYTHIYVTVPADNNGRGYYTLDPVENPTFDKEVKYDHANIYDLNGKKMDLYTGQVPKTQITAPIYSGANSINDDLMNISGRTVGNASDAFLIELMMGEPETMSRYSGVGKKTKEQRKENRQKLKDKLKGAGLLPVRGAFLVIVGLNALKMADRLLKAYHKNPTKVKSFWTNAGGDWEKLKSAMAKGSKQRISGNTTGAAVLVAAAATVALALPLIEQAARMLKDLGVKESAEDDAAMDEELENAEDEGSRPGFYVNMTTTATPGGVVTRPDPAPVPPTAGGDNFIAMDWTDPYQVAYAILKGGFYTGILAQLLNIVN